MNRKEMEREARKKDILETAMYLFAEKDFHEVTVDEIAERVGLSKGTLYLYFENKENLFFTIIQEKTRELFGMLREAAGSQASFTDRLTDLVRAYLGFFDTHKSYFKIMHSEKCRLSEDEHYRMHDHAMEAFGTFFQHMTVFVRSGQEEGALKQAPPVALAKQLQGMLNAFAFHRTFVGNGDALDDDVRQIVDLFLHGANFNQDKR